VAGGSEFGINGTRINNTPRMRHARGS
jgi:hypothetical protein